MNYSSLIMKVNNSKRNVMNSSEIEDYLDIAKQGISTFYNNGQTARYRVDYLVRNQNRDKVIFHTCLAESGPHILMESEIV